MAETVSLPAGVSIYMRKASVDAGKRLRIGDIYYDIKYCGDYVLYYLNAYGGWDSFLIEGKTTRTDTQTTHDYDKQVANTIQAPEKNRYLVEMETTWKLSTCFLTDDEAERLAKHLLTSPKVFLHDLVKQEIYPVNIKTNTAEYKTFENQGRKLVTYTFEVTRATDRIRK